MGPGAGIDPLRQIAQVIIIIIIIIIDVRSTAADPDRFIALLGSTGYTARIIICSFLIMCKKTRNARLFSPEKQCLTYVVCTVPSVSSSNIFEKQDEVPAFFVCKTSLFRLKIDTFSLFLGSGSTPGDPLEPWRQQHLKKMSEF